MVFVLCVVSACLLTYPLWCLGEIAIREWGWTGLSKYGIQKYFNRSFLLCAVIGVLVVRPRFGATGDGLVSSKFDLTVLIRGVILGTLAFAVLLVVGFGLSCITLSEWKSVTKILGKAALAAVVVGYLEEWLFRKHLLNSACRRFGVSGGQIFLAALFASVHFLKPSAPPAGLEIDAWVGFRLLPSIFHQFANPVAIFGGWLTLFALGLLLSRLALGSGIIWPAVGVHAAVIFWNKVLSSLFAVETCLPWFGGNFQSGMVPLLTLSVLAYWATGWGGGSRAVTESRGGG